MKRDVVLTAGILVLAMSQIAPATYTGVWDSSIYNLMEHPRTVAVRFEVVDAETGMPIPNAQVMLKGTYLQVGRTSRHEEGERQESLREYERRIVTSSDGIAVAAFNWQKDYPWSSRVPDEIEKVQEVEVRHTRYKLQTRAVPFALMLDVGQRKESFTQEPSVFKEFDESWKREGRRRDLKYCVFDLGTSFADFQNKKCSHSVFHKKISAKDWGILYTKPRNWFSKGDHPQSLCGPYFVYLMKIRMERVRRHSSDTDTRPRQHAKIDATDDLRGSPTNAGPVGVVQWQKGFLEGLRWRMEGEEVERRLAAKGYSLKVTRSYRLGGTHIHDAEVSGALLYGRYRVDEIRMAFANKKLLSVSFTSADPREADGLYGQMQSEFGPGIEESWTDDDAQESMKSPKLCHSCERYYQTTSVTNKVGYTWSPSARRVVRYCAVTISDWRASDKAYGNNSSQKFSQFQQLRQRAKEDGKIVCSDCNGSGKCLSCNGKGKITRKVTIKCSFPACRGRGWYKVHGAGRQSCRRCQGRGNIVTRETEQVSCGRCRGDGKCRRCQGKGEIDG